MIMQNSFPLELAFLSDHLAFADDCDLVLLDSLESAAVQVDGMSADYGDDLPAMLRQPDIMLDLFNQAVMEELKLRDRRKAS